MKCFFLLLALCIPFFSIAEEEEIEWIPAYLVAEGWKLIPFFDEFGNPDPYLFGDHIPEEEWVEEDESDLYFEDDDDELMSRSVEGPKEDSIPDLPYFEAIPALMVEGCVNVLSGYFMESDIDLVVPGPKALAVQRSWSSKERKWHFGHSPQLQLGFSESGQHLEAGYEDDSGSGMHFRGSENLGDVALPMGIAAPCAKDF